MLRVGYSPAPYAMRNRASSGMFFIVRGSVTLRVAATVQLEATQAQPNFQGRTTSILAGCREERL